VVDHHGHTNRHTCYSIISIRALTIIIIPTDFMMIMSV